MKTDIWNAWNAYRAQKPEESGEPLRAVRLDLPQAAAIPPRQWLYGTTLIRRFVTMLVAPGGVGKSALALAQCVALASGKPFLGETVHHPASAWMLNLEDPVEELHRRLAAVMLHHRLDLATFPHHLFLHSGRDRRVCIARPGPDGSAIVFPDRDVIIAAARAENIGCIMVDPFVKSHGLEENSNVQMDAAATGWAEVAHATGAAVQLVHHVRKPQGGAGTADVDAARGAKSLSPMTVLEAELLGIAETERWRHVRLDDTKANMAPRGSRATWYRLETVNLGNGTPDYPSGDNVGVMVPFQSISVWRRLTPALCNALLDEIAAGPETGLLFAGQRRGRGTERWAGRVLMDRAEMSEGQAAEVIGAWLKSGLLREIPFHDKQQRKTRLGVTVVAAKRPTASQAPQSTGDE